MIESTFSSRVQRENCDRIVSETLHLAFLKHYSPFTTPSDGNCLWHMISISLCGNISLTNILRGKHNLMHAFYSLLLYKISI